MVLQRRRTQVAALLAVCLGASLRRTGAQFSWVEVTDQDALQQGEVLAFAFGERKNQRVVYPLCCSFCGVLIGRKPECSCQQSGVPAAYPPVCLSQARSSAKQSALVRSRCSNSDSYRAATNCEGAAA